MASFYPISSALKRSPAQAVRYVLEADWLLRSLRGIGYLVAGAIVLSQPDWGADHRAVGWLLLAGAAPLAVVVDAWLPPADRFIVSCGFDLGAIVLCAALLPALWSVSLLIGCLLIGCAAAAMTLRRWWPFPLLLVCFGGAMAALAWSRGIDVEPLIAMAAFTPLLSVLTIAERHRQQEAQNRMLLLDGLGTLASGIGQDFNSILTQVQAKAELVEQSLSANHLARVQVRDLLAANQRARLLCSQLQAFAGGSAAAKERLNMRSELRGLIGVLQSAVPRSVDLRLDATREVPLVEADRSQLQQILTFAIARAAEAFGGCRGVVKVSLRKARYRRSRQVLIQVHGAAMSPRPGLGGYFDTSRLGPVLSPLAVQRMLRDHGGSAEVHAAEGSGAVLTLRLPALAAEDAEVAPQPVQPIPRRILFVDDEPQHRELARALLEKLGHDVTVVADGHAALRNIHRGRADFDLVMLDLNMPGLSGWETLDRIDANRRDLPVLIQSGYEQDAVGLAALERRAKTGFLAKPYNSASLNAAISGVLGNH